MIVAHLNNNQSKKKAWMREGSYEWWLIHSDSSSIVRPAFGDLEAIAKAEFKIAIGCNSTSTSPQGPPAK